MRRMMSVVMVVAVAACSKDKGAQTTTTDSTTTTTSAAATTAAAPAAPNIPAQLPPGVTPQMISEGQTIFTSVGPCYTCHGADAKGTQLAPNLTDTTWLNISGKYDEIVNLVKTGVPQPKQHPAPMPPMGGAQLTDEQVKAVAAYVWSLGGGKL